MKQVLCYFSKGFFFCVCVFFGAKTRPTIPSCPSVLADMKLSREGFPQTASSYGLNVLTVQSVRLIHITLSVE